MAAFTITVSPASFVTVTGEVDLSNAHELAAALDQPHSVRLDCTGLTFIDATGFRTLTDAVQQLHERGVRLVVSGLHGEPLTVAGILGFHSTFSDDDMTLFDQIARSA